MMKGKFNYLGLLSLLTLIALLGRATDNPGMYGFLGFAYYLRYFFVLPDEFFRQNVQRAATFAFFAEMVSLVPLIFLCVWLIPQKGLPPAFGLSFAIAILAFTGALIFAEWQEQRGAAE